MIAPGGVGAVERICGTFVGGVDACLASELDSTTGRVLGVKIRECLREMGGVKTPDRATSE